MARWLCLFLLFAVVTVFAGCASDAPADPNRVSTIPWSRPEKWEGQGALGGFSQQNN